MKHRLADRVAGIVPAMGRRPPRGLSSSLEVTAVCTTAFAAGAVAFARDAGIDLREINQIALDVLEGSARPSCTLKKHLIWSRLVISVFPTMSPLSACRQPWTRLPTSRSTNHAVREHPELIADLLSPTSISMVKYRSSRSKCRCPSCRNFALSADRCRNPLVFGLFDRFSRWAGSTTL
jgi:hypothetical protein